MYSSGAQAIAVNRAACGVKKIGLSEYSRPQRWISGCNGIENGLNRSSCKSTLPVNDKAINSSGGAMVRKEGLQNLPIAFSIVRPTRSVPWSSIHAPSASQTVHTRGHLLDKEESVHRVLQRAD